MHGRSLPRTPVRFWASQPSAPTTRGGREKQSVCRPTRCAGSATSPAYTRPCRSCTPIHIWQTTGSTVPTGRSVARLPCSACGLAMLQTWQPYAIIWTQEEHPGASRVTFRRLACVHAWRIIASRYPPNRLFERLTPDPRVWDVLIALEELTNPRARDEV